MADFKDTLVDQKENVIAILGKNYAQNYLDTGNISNGFVILSNERVYFKGSCMYKVNGKYHSSDEERVLDLKDVTGTGFETINPIHLLWTAIGIWILTFFYWISPLSTKGQQFDLIFCIGLVVGAVFAFRYITHKSTIFRIDYAGGNIAFDLVFASQNEAENFNKALRNAKNNIQPQSVNNSFADELRQLNELLQQGIITQADFDIKKKQILGL